MNLTKYPMLLPKTLGSNLIHFWPQFYTPENTRKPLVFLCFQGGVKCEVWQRQVKTKVKKTYILA